MSPKSEIVNGVEVKKCFVRLRRVGYIEAALSRGQTTIDLAIKARPKLKKLKFPSCSKARKTTDI